MSGNVTDTKQATQLVSSALSGKTKIADVIPQIANLQGLQTINKMIDSAQKSGDMATVQQLASIHTQVQQHLNFQAQIGQIVTALSAGFGTPNAPGVTEQRTPMVEQGIGQALTSAPTGNMQTPGQQPGQQVPYLPTNLQTASPAQTNKPVLNPFMQ